MTSPLPSISVFLTPILQSITCGGILYGTSLLQVYRYMINCDGDPLWTRIFVACIFIVETCGTAMSFIALNHYAINSIEDKETVAKLHWTICATPITINIVQVLVSSYYISRMWLYTKSKLLTLITASLVMTRAVGFGYAQRGICAAKTWTDIQSNIITKIPTIVAMTSGPIADGITALAVAMSIHYSSPKVHVRRMRQVLTWILVMTVNTGFILVAIGVCTLVAFIKMPESIAWAGMLFLSGKLYANSLFAMLNGRLALRAKLDRQVSNAPAHEVVLTSVYRSGYPISKSLGESTETDITV